MMTLFTGVPGSGKTAAMVDLLVRMRGQDEHADRPLYVCNLDGFVPDHVDMSAEDAQRWHQVVPDGAIIVIDEVQKVWRPRGPGMKVPDHIAECETHRHRGIDFLLTTQGPKLVDGNIRDLIGRHVHIRDVGFLGRMWYEFPECSMPVAWKTCVTKKRYFLPKRIFGLYKSSSLHVKPVRSVPRVLIVLAVVGAYVVYEGWGMYRKYGAGAAAPPASVAGNKPGSSSVSAGAQTPGGVGGSPAGPPVTARSIVESFTPRIPDRPETAPAYDALRVVVVMPKIAGGYCQGETCRCILQTGRTAHVSDEACRAWLSDPPFDPYRRRDEAPGLPLPYGAAAGQQGGQSERTDGASPTL